MNYKDMKIDDIIEYCQKHNEVEWLKEVVKKEVPVKRYPKTQRQAYDKETNQPLYKKNGAPKMVSCVDKSKPPVIEYEPITFIQIKNEFCEKFFPELIPHKKEKKTTMYRRIAEL